MNMIIKLLGTGCPKCKLLEQTTIETINELGLNANIIKITDMADIMQYDIMALPGIVINEKLVSAGKVLNKDELKILLTSN